MQDFGAVILTGGLLSIASFCLLWIHFHLPNNRLESSSARDGMKFVQVGLDAFTTNATNSSSTNGKKRKSSSGSGNQKRSSFTHKKRKSKVASSPKRPIVRQPRGQTIPTVSSSDKHCPEEQKQLESESKNAVNQDLKAMSPDNKEPEPLPCDETKAADGDESAVANIEPVLLGALSHSRPLEDVKEHPRSCHPNRDFPAAESTDNQPLKENVPAHSDDRAATATMKELEEDASRKKRRRRRRNRSNISQKSRRSSTRDGVDGVDCVLSSGSNGMKNSSEQLKSHDRGHNRKAIGNSVVCTSSNSRTTFGSTTNIVLQMDSEAKRAAVPSPTRPPLKSKRFSSSLGDSLSGSAAKLSSLGTRSLSATNLSRTLDALSPPPQRRKPPKPSSFYRSPNIPFRPYVDDTDNDSTTSGHESKTIHDSDTSSRKRASSGGSKRDDDHLFINATVGDDDDMEQPLFDEDSVASTSMSRTTVTSLSDLSESLPKQEDDWHDQDSDELEQQAVLNQQNGIVPLPLPQAVAVEVGTGLAAISLKSNRGPSKRNRSRGSKQKTQKRDPKKKNHSVSVAAVSYLNETEARTTEPIQRGPPQHFSQDLARSAHIQQQSGVMQNQFPFAVPTFPGQIPFMVPYPGVVDMNNNPPMYDMNMNMNMNMGVPSFFGPTTMVLPMASQSNNDLMTMAPGGHMLLRSNSAPQLISMNSGALFPPMFIPQPPLTPMQSAPIPVSSSTTPLPNGVPSERSLSPEKSGSRGQSDSGTLYVVPTASGGLSFQTDQTLGRNAPDGSVPRLSSDCTSASTPSIVVETAPTPEATMQTPFVPTPQLVTYGTPFAMPTLGGWCDPNFLVNFQNAQMAAQPMVPILQTVPNLPSCLDPETVDRVLTAPLYQPTHIPSTTGGVSAIPNPHLVPSDGS